MVHLSYLIRLALAIVLALGFIGCSGDSGQGQSKSLEPISANQETIASNQKLIAAGKAIYFSSCIACHNADPSQTGPVGPEVSGSSMDLLRSKVLEGTSPPGYSPKRPTQLMVPLPHLKEQIPAIHAFLNQ